MTFLIHFTSVTLFLFSPFFSESDYNLTDKETTCPLWAKAGWCQSNEDLLDKCPHSCQKYGVQGANSLDERYITVNFQNSSSVANSKVVEFVAPPPPSAAIRSHSDLDTVRRITAWWASFKLAKKYSNNLEVSFNLSSFYWNYQEVQLKMFLSDTCQLDVDFLHCWEVVLARFLGKSSI